MTLTGKALEQFEEWYIKLPNAMGLNYGSKEVTLNRFYCLPISMQWGIFQDFADSVGIDMNTDASLGQDSYWKVFYLKHEKYNNLNDEYFATRQEARESAIKKLDELLNQ